MMKQRKLARGWRQPTLPSKLYFRERFLIMRPLRYGEIALFLSLFAFVLSLPGRAADEKDATIHLFNGKDLSNFYTYLGAPPNSKKPYGKNNDPEKVFT